MASEAAVRARLQRAGQEHLLRFCAELEPGPRAALLAELAPLEPEALREHCLRAAAACARPPGPPPDLAARLRPLPPERVGSAVRSDPETRRLWEEEGRRAEARAGRGPAGREVVRGVQFGSYFVKPPSRSHSPALHCGGEPPGALCLRTPGWPVPRPQASWQQGTPGLHTRTPSLHTPVGAGAFLASRPGGEAGVRG